MIFSNAQSPREVLDFMFKQKKVIVVMPAYNAAQTLRRTHEEVLAQEIVDHVILVDDASPDELIQLSQELDPRCPADAMCRSEGRAPSRPWPFSYPVHRRTRRRVSLRA